MKTNQLQVLFDYDNLAENQKKRSLLSIIEDWLNKIPATKILTLTNINVRLYGGWYQENSISRKAQELQTEILSDFPSTIFHYKSNRSLIVNCSMAYSLVSVPGTHLFNTYRERGIPRDIKSIQPSLTICDQSHCLGDLMHQFITKQKCPQCSKVQLNDFMFKGEQKLVDVMITVDLLYIASTEKTVCLASSDEDFIPAIWAITSAGNSIIRLNIKGRNWPFWGAQLIHSNYLEIN